MTRTQTLSISTSRAVSPWWRCRFARLLAPVALVLGLFGANAVHASHPAQQLVEEAVQQVLGKLQSDPERARTDAAFVDAVVREHIVPHLDFDSMTKLSVSKHWRKADKQQRLDLVSEFRDFLLNTYASAMSEYGGEAMEFKPYRAGKRDDRAVVQSLFKQPGSADVPVVYKLHNKTGDWLVYDIEVSDLSLVLQYKSSFASEIERNGIDGLLQVLREKNGKS